MAWRNFQAVTVDTYRTYFRAALLPLVLLAQTMILASLVTSVKEATVDSEDAYTYQYSVNTDGQTETASRQLRSPDCKMTFCSWRMYNTSVSSAYSPFDIYEDLTFALAGNDWPLFCRPDNFGYSREEGEEVFPSLNYSSCSTKFPRYSPALFFNAGYLIMNCSGEFPGKYVLGDSSFNGTILLPSSFVGEAKMYSAPVPVSTEEWALGTCEKHNDNLYEQVAIRVVANANLIARQRSRAAAVAQEALQKFGEAPASKVLVLLLTIDSASRRHFYRKLPRTVDFLRTLESHHVADFLMHNIIGDNSARNQIPLLTGDARIVSRSVKELEGLQDALLHGDGLGNRSLFKYAADRGFATMLSFEFCHQYFATYIGDRPAAHHVMANFWCGAKKFAGFNFEKSVLGQRCIGPKRSHSHMLDYITQFTTAYSGLSQLVYTHITTGHEATGTQISTLDDDLVSFMRDYLRLAEQGDYEVAIILQGDHGMRYGEWYKNIAAFQEHRLPALFTVLSPSLMDRMTASRDVIEHNRKRLVGKLDLYLTVKSLMLASFLPSVSRSNNIYESWRNGDLDHSVSVLLQKISNTRSCSDARIPSFYCACMRMELVKPETVANNTALANIVSAVVHASLEELNAAAFSATSTPKGHICQRVTLKSVNSIYAQRVSMRDEAFKVEFSVNEHATAHFETYTIVGSSQKHVGVKANQEGFLPRVGFFRDRKKRLRMLFLKRLDSYSGFCEEVAFQRAINPALCICQPSSVLLAHDAAVVSPLLQEVKFVWGSETDCSQVCEAKELKCDSSYFEVIADPTFVQTLVNSTTTCVEGDFTGLSNDQCVVRTRKSSCSDSRSSGFALVCPCR